MKKSSKHKNKKSQKKAKQNRQFHQQAAPIQPDEQPTPPADGTVVTAPDAEAAPELLVVPEGEVVPESEVGPEGEVGPEDEVAPASTGVSKPTLVPKPQAGLLAQQPKAPPTKQWNKQIKAGKMVGAHVPKRFNRGG